MKQKPNLQTIRWEWPAGRSTNKKIAITIEALDKKGHGFLGIGKSPSIAENLPDPIRIRGVVLAGDVLAGRNVEIDIPEKELPPLKVGDRIALGLVSESLCICVAAIPESAGDISEWLLTLRCEPD